MNYKRLSRKSLHSLRDEELAFCLNYELERNNLTDLADTTEEFDRRHGTELRQRLADANNALLRLYEDFRKATR
jgi:hypothetical protein